MFMSEDAATAAATAASKAASMMGGGSDVGGSGDGDDDDGWDADDAMLEAREGEQGNIYSRQKKGDGWMDRRTSSEWRLGSTGATPGPRGGICSRSLLLSGMACYSI